MFGQFSEQDTGVGIWAQDFSFHRSPMTYLGYFHDWQISDTEVAVTFGMFEPLMFDAKGVEAHGLEPAALGYPN